MKRLTILLLAALVSMGSFVATQAFAQAGILLGERHVSDASERDTIHVGVKEGKFSGFRIKVTGAPVEFKRIVVHFENGSEQVFEKNRVKGKGSKSRVIDLDGGARFIDKVVFHYEARSRGWKGAEMKFFGVR
jgi:hypothetical protein